MSNRYRNPFKIRASEKLESESNFLRMYSPIILDTLIEKNTEGKLWNNVLFIRSSPGAGKTSLLRIFDPSTLTTVFNNKTVYKDLLGYLKKLEIVNDDSVKLLGVYLSCTRNYEILEDLEIPSAQRKRLFFALINARIILATLRSILSFKPRASYEDILINYSSNEFSFLDIDFPCNGKQLYEWAVDIEKKAFKAIDSFLPAEEIQIKGIDELFCFSILQPCSVSVSGNQVADKFLFMLDDAHKLSLEQRNVLIKYLAEKRGNYNIWIAERLEALDEHENLGSFKNRDYDEINLEEIWQDKTGKFKSIVANISEKRATISTEELNTFQGYLDENLNEDDYKEKFDSVLQSSLSNIKTVSSFGHRFDEWLNYLVTLDESPLKKAITARATQIIVHRNLGKPQLSFEFPLTIQELQEKAAPEIETAAQYLMSIEKKIPYYYSFDNLVKISSNNIEQFLSFAGELYEAMLARKISDHHTNLTSSEQENILKKVADNKWKELNRLVPYADSVLKFLSNLVQFSLKESLERPTAPYAPGVNGFAIREVPSNQLINSGPWESDTVFEPLINVISSCISYNLLEKRRVKQGKEGQVWTVYYLNRWICLRSNLPLSYGGWRHKSPSELLKWTK
jgi:hypothetical protein